MYGLILRIRHLLYDINLFKTCSFNEAIIVIGNLSLGGTGKSPHTMYVAKLLEDYNAAILSRGYGRKSKGFKLVYQDSLANEVGDEPLMFKSYLKNKTVAVCENRCEGIRELLSQDKNLEVVILDDAYQHRALKPGLSILLIDYKSLQGNFFLLPAGRRRDIFSRWQAADIIIITKLEKNEVIEEYAKKFKKKQVFTSSYVYKSLINIKGEVQPLDILSERHIILLTGIADALPLKQEMQKIASELIHLEFKDHQDFEGTALKTIKENIVMFAPKNFLFVTTAKDYARLKDLLSSEELKLWYYVDIEVKLNEPKEFEKLIKSYVERTQRNSSLH